jgi:hypothetical protein
LFQATDRSAGWTVRVSARATRLSVRVYPGGRVEIVAPSRTPPQQVQRFVARHNRWIDAKVAEFRAHRLVAAVRPDSIDLRAVGLRVAVTYVDGAAAARRQSWRAGPAALEIAASQDLAATHELLRRWLLEEARARLVPWLDQVASQAGIDYSCAQVRRQRTRWGSCSRQGTISLNACLLFQAPEVVRYLFLHELCHRRHMNHSERFWSLVARHEPDWRRLDRELVGGWRHVPEWVFQH